MFVFYLNLLEHDYNNYNGIFHYVPSASWTLIFVLLHKIHFKQTFTGKTAVLDYAELQLH